MRQQGHSSWSSSFLDEFCALLVTALRFPKTAIPCAGYTASAVRERLPPFSPGGLASLMLGISLSLMLSGSITFMIGCMMMPWVLGMVMLLFFIAFLSSISMLWKVVLGLASSPFPSRSSQKGIPGHLISRLPIVYILNIKYNRGEHQRGSAGDGQLITFWFTTMEYF